MITTIKKWVAATLAAALFLTAAGCTADPGSNPGSTAPVTSAPQTSAAGTSAPAPDSSAATVPQTPPDPIFDKISFPRIDGSTVTIPLMEAVYMRTVGATEDEARQGIVHNRTHQAYVNLVEGETDIIFVTYPSADELLIAQEAGVTYEIVPVVRDAFIFLVNAANPIESLTATQIREIYAGYTSNWSNVGGLDTPIIPYQRPVNSGSQSGMLELVMKDMAMADAPTEMRPAEMGQLIEAISSYDNAQNAIGYSYYYYARLMYNRENTRFVTVDGVAPTDENIQSGAYPFCTAYYAVLRKDTPEDAPARKLLDWMLSPEGQNTAKEASYVPVS